MHIIYSNGEPNVGYITVLNANIVDVADNLGELLKCGTNSHCIRPGEICKKIYRKPQVKAECQCLNLYSSIPYVNDRYLYFGELKTLKFIETVQSVLTKLLHIIGLMQ